jgi:hypothetical protein
MGYFNTALFLEPFSEIMLLELRHDLVRRAITAFTSSFAEIPLGFLPPASFRVLDAITSA